MAQRVLREVFGDSIPNLVIFVPLAACDPWPRARITQKRVVIAPKILRRLLEGRVSRACAYTHLGLLNFLRAWALSRP